MLTSVEVGQPVMSLGQGSRAVRPSAFHAATPSFPGSPVGSLLGMPEQTALELARTLPEMTVGRSPRPLCWFQELWPLHLSDLALGLPTPVQKLMAGELASPPGSAAGNLPTYPGLLSALSLPARLPFLPPEWTMPWIEAVTHLSLCCLVRNQSCMPHCRLWELSSGTMRW